MGAHDSDQLALVRQLKEQNRQLTVENGALKSGGGDGTSGGMEARVNRLEDRLDKLTDRIGGVEVNLATLAERVAHLPGKGFVVTSAVSTIGLLTAVMLFADRLKDLLGI